MFEKVVSGVLSRYLGKYIEGLNEVSLDVGLRSGNVKLSNLAVRLDALNDLQLPLTVLAGVVQELELSIPWSNLKSSPAIIHLKGVFVRLGPATEDFRTKEFLEREIKTKLHRLQFAELIADSELDSELSEKKNGDSWVTQMITTIVANLQVKINSVHVRFEDFKTNPSNPFAFGFTMDSFLLQTTDQNYKPAFLSESGTTELVYKLARLSHFGVYWDQNIRRLPSGNLAFQVMEKLIFRGEKYPNFNYIVRPFSTELKLRLNQSFGANEFPKVTVDLVQNRFGFFVKQFQIQGILDFVDRMANFTKSFQYGRFREKQMLEIHQALKNHPKLDEKGKMMRKKLAEHRWIFCCQAVMHDVQEKRKSWKWETMKQSRHSCRQYVNLYIKKKKKVAQPLDLRQIESYERLMDFEWLLFCRRIGFQFLKKDREFQIAHRKMKKQKRKEAEGLNWFKALVEEVEESDASLQMTPEVWKELHGLLEGDSLSKLSDSSSTSAVADEIIASLSIGTFRCVLLEDSSKDDDDFLASLRCDGFRATLSSGRDAQNFFLQSGDVEVLDGTSPNTLFPVVLQSLTSNSPKGAKQSLKLDLKRKKIEDDIFYILNGSLNPSVLVVSVPLALRLRTFFIPEDRKSTIAELEKETIAKLQNLADETRMNFNQTLLDSHSHLQVRASLHGPRIIFPLEISNGMAPSLCWDVGTFQIASCEEAEKESGKEEEKGEEKEEGLEVKPFMYRSFDIHLKDTKIVLASAQEIQSEMEKELSRPPFAVPSHVDFKLYLSRVMLFKAPKIQVIGKMPSLQIQMTPEELGKCVAIADNLSQIESSNTLPSSPSFLSANSSNSSLLSNQLAQFVDSTEIGGFFQDISQFGKYMNSNRFSKSNRREQWLLDLQFQIPEIEFTLKSDLTGKNTTPDPIFVLRVNQVNFKAGLHNFHNHIGVTIQKAHIEDMSSRKNNIVFSTFSEKSEWDIRVEGLMRSKASPSYVCLDDSFKVHIDASRFSFRRPLLAKLKSCGDSFKRTKKKWGKNRHSPPPSLSPLSPSALSPSRIGKNKPLVLDLCVKLEIEKIVVSLDLEETWEENIGQFVLEGANFVYLEGNDGGEFVAGSLNRLSLFNSLPDPTGWKAVIQEDLRGAEDLVRFEITQCRQETPQAEPPILQPPEMSEKEKKSPSASVSSLSPSPSSLTERERKCKVIDVNVALSRVQIIVVIPYLSVLAMYFVEFGEMLKKEGKANLEEREKEGNEEFFSLGLGLREVTVIVPSLNQKENASFLFGSVESLKLSHSGPIQKMGPFLSSETTISASHLRVESFLSKRTLGMIDLEESQPEAIRKVSVVTQNGITFQTLLSPLATHHKIEKKIEKITGIPSHLQQIRVFSEKRSLVLETGDDISSLLSIQGDEAKELKERRQDAVEEVLLILVEEIEEDWRSEERKGKEEEKEELEEGEIVEEEIEEEGENESDEREDFMSVCSNRFFLSKRDRLRFLGRESDHILIEETSLDVKIEKVEPSLILWKKSQKNKEKEESLSPLSSRSSSSSSPSVFLSPPPLPPLLSISLNCPELIVCLSQPELDLLYSTAIFNLSSTPLQMYSSSSSSLLMLLEREKKREEKKRSKKQKGWEETDEEKEELIEENPLFLSLLSLFKRTLLFQGKLEKFETRFRPFGRTQDIVSLQFDALSVELDERKENNETKREQKERKVCLQVERGRVASLLMSENDPSFSNLVSLIPQKDQEKKPQIQIKMIENENGEDIDVEIASSQIILTAAYGPIIGFLNDLLSDLDYVNGIIQKKSLSFPSSSPDPAPVSPSCPISSLTNVNLSFPKCEFVFPKDPTNPSSEVFILRSGAMVISAVLSPSDVLFIQIHTQSLCFLRCNWKKRENLQMLLEPFDVEVMMNANSPKKTQLRLSRIGNCYFYTSFRDLQIALGAIDQISTMVKVGVIEHVSNSFVSRYGSDPILNSDPLPDFDSKTLVAEIEPFSFHFILVDDSAGADIPIVQFDLFVSQGDAAGSTYQLSHRPLSSSSLSSSSQDGIVGARSPLVDSSDSSLSSSEANKTTKTSSVMFKIGTEFHIDFYNRQHGVWEPLIEKWDPEILVARTTVTESETELSNYSVQIITETPFNANISSNMINTFLGSFESAQEALKEDRRVAAVFGADAPSPSKNRHFFYRDPESDNLLRASHVIKNQTGFDLSVLVPEKERIILKSGEVRGLPIGRGENRGTHLRGKKIISSRKIQIGFYHQFEEEEKFQTRKKGVVATEGAMANFDERDDFLVPIDRCIQLCRVFSTLDSSIISSVYYRKGYQVIEVRSRIVIENTTGKTIDLYFSNSKMKKTHLLNQGEECSVPIQYIERGTIRYRLKQDQYGWTKAIRLASLTSNIQDYVTTLMCPFSDKDGRILENESFCMRQRVLHKTPDHFSIKIVLTPLLTVRNDLAETLVYKISSPDGRKILAMKEIEMGKEAQITHLLSEKTIWFCLKLNGFSWSKHIPIDFKTGKQCITLSDIEGRELLLWIRSSRKRGQSRCLTIFSSYWLVNKTGLPLVYKEMSLRTKMESRLPRQQNLSSSLSFPLFQTKQQALWYKKREEDSLLSLETPFVFSFSGKGEREWGEGERESGRRGREREIVPENHRLCVRVGRSDWSQGLFLPSADFTTAFQIDEQSSKEKRGRRFEIVASAERASGSFWRTLIVKFAPRYVLVNLLPIPFSFWQVGSEAEILRAGEKIPFHWMDNQQPQLLRIALVPCPENPETFPSGFLDLKTIQRLTLPLRWKSDDEAPYFNIRKRQKTSFPSNSIYLTITPIVRDGTTFLTFRDEGEKTVPQFLIQNRIQKAIRFGQSLQSEENFTLKDPKPHGYQLSPGASTQWSFPQPIVLKKKLLLFLPTSSSPIEIDPSSPSLPPNCPISLQIIENGPTKNILILPPSSSSSSASVLKVVPTLERKSKKTFEFSMGIEITRMGLSVIDQRQELLFATLSNIDFRLSESDLRRHVRFAILDLQIDNQLYNRPYEVAVCPGPLCTNERPFIEFISEILKRNDDLLFFDSVTFDVQDIDINLDSEFVVRLAKVASRVSHFIDRQKSENPLSIAQEFPEIPSEVLENNSTDSFLFIREICISQIKSVFSFMVVNQQEGEEGKRELMELEEEGENEDALSTLTRHASILSFLLNVSDASIKLNELNVSDVYVQSSEFVRQVEAHYLQSITKHLYWLIGASDALGSPLHFIYGVSTGLFDFFNEPLKEIGTGNVGRGIVRGSQSLVSGTVGGTLGSAAKISGSLSRGLSNMSTNSDFSSSQEKLTRRKATSLSSGLGQGLFSFGSGLMSGVYGVVSDPVKGFNEGGVGGLAMGVASGVTGLVTKPASGALGMVSKTAEGFQSVTLPERRNKRKRHPRYVGRDMVLKTYDKGQATGQYLLHTYFKVRPNEFYEAHYRTFQTMGILITNRRIIFMEVQEEVARRIDEQPLRAISSIGFHKAATQQTHSAIEFTTISQEKMSIPCTTKTLQIYESLRNLIESLTGKQLKFESQKGAPPPVRRSTRPPPQSPALTLSDSGDIFSEEQLSFSSSSSPSPLRSSLEIQESYFVIYSAVNPNLVLDYQKYSSDKVEVVKCLASEYNPKKKSQRWVVKQRSIVSLCSGLSLRLLKTPSGNPTLRLSDCTPTQRFSFQKNEWTSIVTGEFALEVQQHQSQSETTFVTVAHSNGQPNQLFRFVGVE